MDAGKNPIVRGRHQALAVLIEEHGLKGTSIVQRAQESNSIGSGTRYGLLAFNVCTVHRFLVLEWNDVVFESFAWDL